MPPTASTVTQPGFKVKFWLMNANTIKKISKDVGEEDFRVLKIVFSASKSFGLIKWSDFHVRCSWWILVRIAKI